MDVVKGVVQVGGQWPGASDGVGTGLDFDGAVPAAGVIGAHLPLLLASDQIFQRVKSASINFSESFARLFEDGIADGSLAPPGGDPRKRPSCCLTRSAGPTCSYATAIAGRPNAPGTACAD